MTTEHGDAEPYESDLAELLRLAARVTVLSSIAAVLQELCGEVTDSAAPAE